MMFLSGRAGAAGRARPRGVALPPVAPERREEGEEEAGGGGG